MTYPTISHFLESLTGIFVPLPIQTFGFFIVLAFALGGYFIYKSFLQLEFNNVLKPITIDKKRQVRGLVIDYIFNGIMSFVLGYKILYVIQNYSLFTQSPQKILISSEGNFLLGLIFFIITSIYTYYVNYHNKKFTNLHVKPSQLTWNFILVAAISGIIGAKLFAVFENIDYLLQDPISALLSFSGLTFYGGFIFGTIFVILYAKTNNIKVSDLSDVFAPSLILAYGVGRLGCHFSGDGDWGIISDLNNKPFFLPDWLWGYKFPRNVIEFQGDGSGLPPFGELIEGCVGKYCYQLSHTVYPTSLYEAIFCIIAFIFLWNIRKYIKKSGTIFCIYLIINGVERFLIEIIRITEKYTILSSKSIFSYPIELTQAQIIAIIIIIIGFSGIIYLNKKTNEPIKE